MIRRTPRSTRTDTLCPYTTLFRSLAGLGFGGDADLGLTVERRHAHGVAERGLRNADRDFAVQVVAVAHEDLVRAHAHLDVQVARRRARRAGLALAGQADAVAAVDARADERRVGKEGVSTCRSRWSP